MNLSPAKDGDLHRLPPVTKRNDTMADETLDPDFANLPPAARAEIEALSGIGLHHAPAGGDAPSTGEAFHQPGQGAEDAATGLNWVPIETYRDGEIVMLDDGERQLLGRREMGLWMELIDGEERAQPDYQPMLWSYAPDQMKYDRM